jgi:hypothetical protein
MTMRGASLRSCARNRHVKSVAAIASLDHALRLSPRSAERERVTGWTRLDVNIVRHLHIATEAGSATDFDLVEPMPAPDDHRLPLVAIAGDRSRFSPRPMQAQVIARAAV